MQIRIVQSIVLTMLVAVFAACAVENLPSATTNAPMAGKDANMNSQAATPVIINKQKFPRAAEIESSMWLNSPVLNWDELRGQVVVVNFWTFACYNCKNTLPYFKAWDEKFRAQGLVIIGVHTPELSFERDLANVQQAVQEYGIQYPVAMDGDYANWNRYGVRAWPTWFIVDKEGYIRYSHIGEGDYARTEQVIQELLAE